MGAMEPGRWQFWQARSKIGAMSFENVGVFTGPPSTSAARAADEIMTHSDAPVSNSESQRETGVTRENRQSIMATSLRKPFRESWLANSSELYPNGTDAGASP